jgi:hypothetical protein
MSLHKVRYLRLGLVILLEFSFPESGFPAAAVAASRHTEETVGRAVPASVVIVADGSPGSQQRTVNGIVQTLIAEFGGDIQLQLVRFDAEPDQQTAGSTDGRMQVSFLDLPARTPMRDALMTVLSERQGLLTHTQALVLVASEEFYGSSISRSRLVGTARQREVPIYSILLTPPANRQRSSFIKSFGRALSHIAIWIVEGLIEEEGRPSVRDTSLLAEELANATDGRTYSATDYESGVSRVREITEQIKRLR